MGISNLFEHYCGKLMQELAEGQKMNIFQVIHEIRCLSKGCVYFGVDWKTSGTYGNVHVHVWILNSS